MTVGRRVFEKLVSVAMVGVAVGLAVPTAAQSPQITAATAVVFSDWVASVEHHSPGQVDEALMDVERMSATDRGELRNGMSTFRDALEKKTVRVSSAAQKRIADLGNDLAREGGAARFIERAVTLHGDAAVVAILRPDVVPATARMTPNEALGLGPRPGQQLLERDGEIVGVAETNWNWAFARELISLEKTQSSSFAGDWFHVTTTFLMSRRMFGEASSQLSLAATLVPKDARIFFDRACYAEMQGSPTSQALLSAEDVAQMRGQESGMTRGSLLGRSNLAVRSGVRPAEKENADAEKFFGWALDIDPEFVEARVRLARLIDLRGRHAEASTELTRALASQAKVERPDPVVTFWLHLFSGRVDRANGALERAAAHFDAALAIFPSAQSALLGASQVALLRADFDGALTPLRALEGRSNGVDFRTDPWWYYYLGPGRNAELLLSEFWTKVRAR